VPTVWHAANVSASPGIVTPQFDSKFPPSISRGHVGCTLGMPIAKEDRIVGNIAFETEGQIQASGIALSVLCMLIRRSVKGVCRRRYTRRIRLQGTSNMLRITVTESASEQRWVIQGRLTGSSLEELTTSWRANRDCPPTKSRIVDLNGITCIDKDGEQVLLMMIRDGAKFVATGLYTKHLLESLSGKH
jgi:hypothetical protein